MVVDSFIIRGPPGMNFIHVACDQSLMNLPITKLHAVLLFFTE